MQLVLVEVRIALNKLLTARDKLGLRCLLVNCEPEGITEIRKNNIENLKKLGFDVISCKTKSQSNEAL